MSGIVTNEPDQIIDLFKRLDVRLYHRVLVQVLTEIFDQDYLDPEPMMKSVMSEVMDNVSERLQDEE